MTQCVAIVEPYSSGKYLAEEFFRRGIRCVAVKATTEPPPCYGSIPLESSYEAVLDYQQLGDELIGELEKWGVAAAIPGSEAGVRLADKLSVRLNLPHNLTSCAEARRDKYLMQEKLSSCGLRSIRQRLVRTEDEAILAAHEIGFPVIIKPTDSAGADSVFKCSDDEAIRVRFRQTFQATNYMGVVNQALLIQEYLEGEEYIVDAVSHDGRHHTTNVCKYKKISANGSDFNYRETSYVEWDTEVARQLIAYNDQVLDALGIVIGASHSEVVITADGPVLIEVGSRMCGADGPKVIQTIADHSQIDLTADSYIAPAEFARKTSKPFSYNLHAKFHYTVAREAGTVKSIDFEKVHSALKTLYQPSWHIKPGQQVVKTVDLMTCPVWFVLISDDPQAIAEDQATLLAMEERGELYELEVPAGRAEEKKCFLIFEPMNHMWLVVKAARDKGYHTVVVHNEPLSAVAPYDEGLRCIDQTIEVQDWFDHRQVIDTVDRVLRGRVIAGTYACAEYTLEAEARFREHRQLPGTRFETLALILDKCRLREFLFQRGLTAAKAYSPEALQSPEHWHNGNRFYLKPKKGSGSALVAKIENRRQLNQALSAWSHKDAVHIDNLKRYIDSGVDFYLEDAVEGKLISAESLVNNGEVRILGLTSRTLLRSDDAIEMGACFPFRPENEEKIRDYVIAIHKAIGYHHGASHVELKLSDSGELDYIEFNARFAGADVLLAINTALDLKIEDYLVDLSVDELHEYPVTDQVCKFTSLQYLLAPSSVETIDSIEIPPEDVCMIKLSLVEGERLNQTRNQLDHLGGFMVSAGTYPDVLAKARSVRQAIKINGVTIKDDDNNAVIYH